MDSISVTGQLVDVVRREIYGAEVTIQGGKIASITRKNVASGPYITPGFIDAHIHVESSMLIPAEFARLSVVHGTVGVVADPHEIANVLGVEGVRFMIANGQSTPLKFFFGVPSCVPATPLESSGASLGVDAVHQLLKERDLFFLAEMMNFPGVISGFPDVLEKLQAAKSSGKVVDGHAPGVTGEALRKYIAAGITTDHECFTLAEAKEKIGLGMKVSIREGSAAKNFEALYPVIKENPGMVMFCSDDKHPNDLAEGHIDQLVKRAIGLGCDLFSVLDAATVTPIKHYRLSVGLLQVGDSADLLIVEDLKDWKVQATFINGEKVAEKGKALFTSGRVAPINKFSCTPVKEQDLAVKAKGNLMRVIEVLPGELITNELQVKPTVVQGEVVSNIPKDILKLVVINRYQAAPLALGFVHGFGLKAGALASSVAHDSHNIVAIGTNDADLVCAINKVIETKGGISAAQGEKIWNLPLPIAGIMTGADGYETASQYEALDKKAKELGSPLPAPFMTLSFLALLVIPKLKLGDRGLFDGEKFQFTELFV